MEKARKQSEDAAFNWRNWAVGFVVWTIIGLSFASRNYFSFYQNETPVRWEEIYSNFLIDFYLWGIVSPLIFKLARKFSQQNLKKFNEFVTNRSAVRLCL